MAKWQNIAAAQNIPEFTVADLLLSNGKTMRATWKAVPGTLGNCSKKAEKIPTMITAWWPEKPRNGRDYYGLYEPLSFRLVGEDVGV